MSVAAAIRLTSADDAALIHDAAEYARRRAQTCYVVCVVDELPYGSDADAARETVQRNLQLVEELNATPVLQEGDDVAEALLAVASGFGIETLFLRGSPPHGGRRSTAERLLYLDPPFDVVVVPCCGPSGVRG